jgi:hypothetical protein
MLEFSKSKSNINGAAVLKPPNGYIVMRNNMKLDSQGLKMIIQD